MTCITLKTKGDLDDRVEEFEDTYHALQERMSELIQETLVAFGLNEDRTVIEAEGSTYHRLSDDLLQRYIALRKFLQGMGDVMLLLHDIVFAEFVSRTLKTPRAK